MGLFARYKRCLDDLSGSRLLGARVSPLVPHSQTMSLALRYSIVPLISTLVAAGALVNITVDDSGLNQLTGLGFSYSPTDDWNFGPTCTKCSVHLDPSQLLMGTWHDATASDGSQGLQSATLDFNGNVLELFPAWPTPNVAL